MMCTVSTLDEMALVLEIMKKATSKDLKEPESNFVHLSVQPENLVMVVSTRDIFISASIEAEMNRAGEISVPIARLAAFVKSVRRKPSATLSAVDGNLECGVDGIGFIEIYGLPKDNLMLPAKREFLDKTTVDPGFIHALKTASGFAQNSAMGASQPMRETVFGRVAIFNDMVIGCTPETIFAKTLETSLSTATSMTVSHIANSFPLLKVDGDINLLRGGGWLGFEVGNLVVAERTPLMDTYPTREQFDKILTPSEDALPVSFSGAEMLDILEISASVGNEEFPKIIINPQEKTVQTAMDVAMAELLIPSFTIQSDKHIVLNRNTFLSMIRCIWDKDIDIINGYVTNPTKSPMLTLVQDDAKVGTMLMKVGE